MPAPDPDELIVRFGTDRWSAGNVLSTVLACFRAATSRAAAVEAKRRTGSGGSIHRCICADTSQLCRDN